MFKSYKLIVLGVLISANFSCKDKVENETNNSSIVYEKEINKIEIEDDKFKVIEDSPELDCHYKEEFEKFRFILNNNKLDSLLSHIELPFNSDNVWYAINIKSENQDYDSSIPFDETEFKIYSDKLFSSDFIKVINDIDLKKIFDEGSYSTNKLISYIDGNIDYEYNLNGSYDNSNKKLILTLNYWFHDEKEVNESSINYFFKFTGCILQLKDIIVAG